VSDYLLLGLFHETVPTADAIESLRALGITDEEITVMSGVPYRSQMLGRAPRYERLVPIALVGALSGLVIALFQPLYAIPPTLIIVFEFTMLGTMIATFGGLLAESRFPLFGRQAFDRRITEGHIGLLVRVHEGLLARAKAVLEEHDAHHIQEMAAQDPVRRRIWLRWALIIVLLFIPITFALLLTYSVIAIPLPDQMVVQPSIDYEGAPRLAAPEGAVPIDGPGMIAGQPASQPSPASVSSIERGRILYGIDCQLCHGGTGNGESDLAEFFTPPPADLTASDVQGLSDQTILIIITEGHGNMPSLAENLYPSQRWDVIHYLRTLHNEEK
jgi:mono/diheme cytochrome c family protein